MVQRRRLRLLIPDRERQSILTSAGELPSLDVDLSERETTTAAAWRVLPSVGLSGPVLDCFVDQSRASVDDDVEVHAALVELDGPPDGWVAPGGWEWAPLRGPAPRVDPGLESGFNERIAELRGDRPVPELRVPWGREGWYERASDWIATVLRAEGRPAPTEIVQVRHWGISAVMRVDTAADRYWFKASFGPFRREAAITAALDRAAPGEITRVVAADEERGWLLLEDIDGVVVGEDPAPTRAAFDHLVDVQLALAGREEELRAAGCPRRPISELPDLLRVALDTPLLRALDFTPRRIEQLIARLTEAVDAVQAVGVPDTFVHGDFHPGNAMATPDGIRIFDWSDAAYTNPLVDVATWASWFHDDQPRVESIYRTFHDARAEKLGDPPGTGLDRLDRGTLEAVAGAYHTLSYVGILGALEPHRRAEHAEGINEFFTLLDSATPP
ncbi:MAG: aminoglycoside phosphotransferase family protein [Ilumatobacter sp.]|nr:aminoglycoside phosphotransferase family protein [Ilumatobacter sp.]